MNVQSTMMQGKGATVKVGGTPQVVLVELKSRILGALSKLSDRDTHQVGLEDLESIAHSLTGDGIGIFLSCLFETDVQQKLVLRKECVRLIGTLSTLHGELLSPHLPRIVNNIVRRLKDPDSAVRDACVDVIGMLAANVPYPGGASAGSGDDIASVAASSAAVGVYMKPLLDALSEQSKGVQVGASLCLSRVFDEVERTPTGIVQRLVPRIVKMLTSPIFQAKAGMLCVVGSLARAIGAAGSAEAPLLAMVVPVLPECLGSSDWTIRKAAADTLVRMAVVLEPALSPYKAAIVPALEGCRFDKIKPVRDSVNDAVAHWKNVPDVDLSPSGGNVKHAGEPSSSAGRSEDEAPKPRKAAFGLAEEMSSSEGFLSTRKRSPLLSDRKPNPDFFRKLDKSSDGVKIEVCAPPLPWGSRQEVDKDAPKASYSDSTGIKQSVSLHQPKSDSAPHGEYSTDATGAQTTSKRAMHTTGSSMKPDNGRGNVGQAYAYSAYSASPNVDFDTMTASDPIMWSAIRKHLEEIERQQAHLLDMFRSFAGSSQDGMAKLEATIRGLESAVSHITQQAAAWRLAASGSGSDTSSEVQVRKSKYNGPHEPVPPGKSGKGDYTELMMERGANPNRSSYDSSELSPVNHMNLHGGPASDSQGDDDSPKYPVNEDIATAKGDPKSGFQFGSGWPSRSVWQSADLQTEVVRAGLNLYRSNHR